MSQKRLNHKTLMNTTETKEIKRVGRPTYLFRDEEALIVTVSKMKGDHSFPETQKIIGNKLNSVLESLGHRDRDIKPKTKVAYACAVIRRVNQIEDEHIGQQKRSSTGEIKVRGLSHKRTKQSDPRLQWIMFHKMCIMYRCVRE